MSFPWRDGAKSRLNFVVRLLTNDLGRKKHHNQGTGQSSSYQYQRLGKDEFRLAVLLPGKWNEDIRLQIQQHSVHNCPPYAAGSYAWGSELASSVVWIDDVAHEVSENLWFFLQAIRGRTNLVWIDQICVNQASDAEKTHQLPLMTKIYQGAATVICWLGKDDQNHAKMAFTMLEDWHSAIKDARKKRQVLKRLTKQLAEYNSVRRTEFAEQIALRNMFSNEYFKRIWPLQEVCVSHDTNPVLLWGEWYMRWNSLYKALPTIKGMISYEDFVALAGEDVRYCATTLSLSWNDINGPSMYNLSHLLTRTSHRFAKDPRDRVFALLGMCALNGHHYPAADYGWTEAQVSVIYARACIVEDKSMRILYTPRPEEHHEDLPSWRIDLCRQGGAGLPLEEAYDKNVEPKTRYKACLNTLPKLERGRSIDDPVLAVRGVLLDRIERLVSLVDAPKYLCSHGGPGSPTWYQILKQCQRFCEELKVPARDANTGESNVEVMLRTLAKDQFPTLSLHSETLPVSSRVSGVYEAYEREYKNASSNRLFKSAPRLLSLNEFLDYISVHFSFRRPDECSSQGYGTAHLPPSQDPFIPTIWLDRTMVDLLVDRFEAAREDWQLALSTQGLICLAHFQVKTGDEIGVVYGGTVPLALRMSQRSRGYELMGEIYVHGYMYGRALTEGRREEVFPLI